MIFTQENSRTVLAAAILSVGLGISPLLSAHDHQHHHAPAPGQAEVKTPADVPSLKILLPETGAVVGSQLALVFETPANLSSMTMSAPVVGVHLHIECDDLALMPTAQQLILLGNHRYLFLFDLPATPGPKKLRVYWSDAQHKTIETTVQTVSVTVGPDTTK